MAIPIPLINKTGYGPLPSELAWEGHITDWIDSLPAYDNHAGQSRFLDSARQILQSFEYYALPIPFPIIDTGVTSNVGPLGQINGAITVPTGSYLLQMTGTSLQPGGFKVGVYDKGTQSSMFQGLDAEYINFAPPDLSFLPGTGPYAREVQGSYTVPSSYVMVTPGVLQIKLTNLDRTSSGNLIQVLFWFAAPFNVNATGLNVVEDEGALPTSG